MVLRVVAPAPVRDVPPQRSAPPESGNPAIRRLQALLILIFGAALPAVFAAISAHPPRTRDIHIEAYRYGFSPSRIQVNRGDRLRLTFSTRDTGQSFFLQDYDLHVSITPGNKLVSVQRLSRPDDPPELMETVEIVAGLPGWQGRLISKSQFRNHTYNGPLHGTERGELIVSPNFLLYGALGLLAAIPLAGWIMAGLRPTDGSRSRPINLFRLFPWLKQTVKAPTFQFNLALPMLGVFWFVVLAGLLGTKVSGRNAGPMIVWVLWLSALIVLLVPIGGRIWCTVCPLPLLGEWLQRLRLARNPDGWNSQSPRWPAWLRTAWPRVVLFLLLGTFSTTLVALPPATSWMLIGLVFLAIVVSFLSEDRSFCRYLCPINGYISIYSTTGRLAVRSVSSQKCATCEEHFCLTGSVHGWGCPYGLCVGEMNRNNDCGVCMECVKTCAYDNVALFWRKTGWDQDIASYGEALQVIVMFALACLYSIVNLGAWDRIRSWIDIVDQRNWGTFWLYATVVWVMCLGVLPLLWYALARAGIALSGSAVPPGAQFRTTSAALIPLGMACWITFALATLLSMMTFLLQSLSDPFNWGWNLLGMAGSRWHIIWSPAIPWLQVACVLTGAAYAMRTLYRCWLGAASERRRAILGSLPLGSFLWMAAAGMIFFFAG
ncbi:MAG TPA: 4Fe-4S binding protein [Bryobacteraceae bacterium]|nr:4Fe-4S binding protein [Bryobacteraceae bacterium]